MQELFAPDSASTPEETFVLNNEQLKLLEGFLKLAGMMLRTGRASLLLYDARLRQLYPFRTYQVNSAPRRTIRDRSRETRPLSRLRRSEFSPQPELMPVTALPSDPFDQLLPNYVYNAGSSLSYPIALDGQPYAFFKAEEREDGLPYTEREQTMLELLVSQLLLALPATNPENNSAGSNNPTLPGEDYLQAHLPGEIERARRHNFNLSLMSLGVNLTLADLLPNVPDPETRQAYLQDVISHVAREVRRNLRSFDVLCQIDGQEFAVVLPHTNEIEGYYVARKLINQLDNDISLSPTTRKAVSLAIGISTYPVLANNAPVLVKQSRQALAQARKTKMAGHSVYIWGSSRHFDLTKLSEVQDEEVARAMLRGFGYISLANGVTSILLNAIPWEISRQHLCLAVSERQAVLTVAMADPGDSGLIALLARATGRSIVPLVARRAEIEAILENLARKRQPQ